ncbi:MAG TPA: SMC family ATPase [Ktedonobacterales bacterium]|jgi:exonuclease SbcC
MLITKVELENIKSYRSASITLGQGTTAIRGQNGAGKTTLVEAIGFALFDYLSYNHQQFVREGERTGTITVTFISGVDSREYQVVRRCGVGAAWYVYDPELDGRVVDQKTDVVDWLKRYLPVQGELELRALFADALGVQQGTFTSDFLATPVNRKKKFDALLQVEEYRTAYEKLVETRNHLQERISQQNVRIKELEVQTKELEAWRVELLNKQAEQGTLAQDLGLTQERRDQAEEQLEAVSKRAEALKQLEGEQTQAQEALERASHTLAQAQTQLEEAQAAQSKLEETTADHKRYGELEDELRNADEERRQRDDLRRRQAEIQLRLAEVQSKQANARELLTRAEAAQQQVERLKPMMQRQLELEQQLYAARQQLLRLGEMEGQGKQLEAEQRNLTMQLAAINQRIAEIEHLRNDAVLLIERREQVQALRLEVGRRADYERERGQVRQECEAEEARRPQAQALVEKYQGQIARIQGRRPLVEELPRLETAFSELEQQVISLRTNIKRHNESRLQSTGGQCPFLHEPCLNIKQRGLSSLESYFERLMERDQTALTPLEARRADLEKKVQDGRQAKPYVEDLPRYEQALYDAQTNLQNLQEKLKRLATRERELLGTLQALEGKKRQLAQAEELLKQSDEADKQMRLLEGLAGQQDAFQKQLAPLKRKREELLAEQRALADAPAREKAAESELRTLGDPRREYDKQEILASQAEEARVLLKQAEQALQQESGRMKTLEAELAPYAELDTRIQALTAERDRCRAGHETYLENQQAAAKLPGCKAAHQQASADERKAQAQAQEAARSYEEQSAGFDPQAEARLKKEIDDLRNESARQRERLRTLKDEIVAHQQKIAQAEQQQGELEVARAEKRELEETQAMLQHFRETIRDAGPHVMKELLKLISKTANTIFGEILGDRSVELSWEEDYEIKLRSRGQERSFMQLSGGEQMSAALAVRLALLKMLARLDVAFFDEPTQNMDDLRRSNLAEQIRRVRGFNQLIVISHDDTFEQGLDSVIFLHKRDGETVIAEGELALVGAGLEREEE